MIKPSVSIVLDKRRKKQSGCYPVKLRVYFNEETKRYPTGIDLTERDFNKSYEAEKPRNEFRDLAMRIRGIELKAHEVVRNLPEFSYEGFERAFFRVSGSNSDVFTHYSEAVNRLTQDGQIGTASSYDLSAKSLRQFLRDTNRRKEGLQFSAITVTFLREYERWMLEKGKSLTTVGIYLRPLRAIFNSAIADGEIQKEIYPFGKKQYQIPAGRNLKKALDEADLQLLFEAEVQPGSPMEKARDFWFFSYLCNGMNVRDILELKFENLDLKKKTLSFTRHKTKNTTKAFQRPIILFLHTFAEKVITKYGGERQSPNDFVFPILNASMDPKERLRTVQNFVRFVNQHIKKLSDQVGIEKNISTYWARHSFTTVAVRNGTSLEIIQESLGHKSITTTMNYLAGFPDKVKKDLSDKLLPFAK